MLIKVAINGGRKRTEHASIPVSPEEEALKSVLAKLQNPSPVLLHGTEATVWPMLDEAVNRGYDVRIGLEDTLVMPDGRMAKDNAELVFEAVRRVRAASNR